MPSARHRIRNPSVRPLRVFAFDPSSGRRRDNEMTLYVPYERLHKGGPAAGRRVAVVDWDSSHSCFYEPVDLDDPRLLVRGGLSPSESDPRFHQQMVYAVVMETVQRFEAALGRRIHWRRADRSGGDAAAAAAGDIWTLKLFPHAMAEANAFYSPEAQGILFGYFRADASNPGRNVPGQVVYTCLSHDIIVHETTHAVIDGIRKYFTEPTNLDVAAFHEAFADLAALFRHFSHSEVLFETIRSTGGRLSDAFLQTDPRVSPADGAGGAAPPRTQDEIAQRNPLIGLARQFGDAIGRNDALRSALGTPATPDDYRTKTEPHDRGSVLVAAVFDAYFAVYMKRTAPLFEVYRAAGGIVDPRDPYVPTALAELLANEAARAAEEFFRLCARSLDYCPPVDVTFGDFLRALLTSDTDLDPRDADGVRDALMEAFRLRGIVPSGASSFTEDGLRWEDVRDDPSVKPIGGLSFETAVGRVRATNDARARVLETWGRRNARRLGLDPALPVEADSFHLVSRLGPDGAVRVEMVVELVQQRPVPFDARSSGFGRFPFRGGVTLIVAAPTSSSPKPRVHYVIPKPIVGEEGDARAERQRQFYSRSGLCEGADPRRFRLNLALVHGGF